MSLLSKAREAAFNVANFGEKASNLVFAPQKAAIEGITSQVKNNVKTGTTLAKAGVKTIAEKGVTVPAAFFEKAMMDVTGKTTKNYMPKYYKSEYDKVSGIGQLAQDLLGNAVTTSSVVGSAANPAFGIKNAAFGTGVGGILKAGENIYKGNPLTTDLLKSAKEGARYGVETSATQVLTNGLVQKLAGKIPFFKPLVEGEILKNAPQVGQSFAQWAKSAGKTLLKREIRAVVMETPIEGLTYGVVNKRKDQKLVDSVVEQTWQNLIFNTAYAGVNSAWDSRAIAPIIKRSFDDALAKVGQGGFIKPSEYVPKFKGTPKSLLDVYKRGETSRNASDLMKDVTVGKILPEPELFQKAIDGGFVKGSMDELDGLMKHVVTVAQYDVAYKARTAALLDSENAVKTLASTKSVVPVTNDSQLDLKILRAVAKDLPEGDAGNVMGRPIWRYIEVLQREPNLTDAQKVSRFIAIEDMLPEQFKSQVDFVKSSFLNKPGVMDSLSPGDKVRNALASSTELPKQIPINGVMVDVPKNWTRTDIETRWAQLIPKAEDTNPTLKLAKDKGVPVTESGYQDNARVAKILSSNDAYKYQKVVTYAQAIVADPNMKPQEKNIRIDNVIAEIKKSNPEMTAQQEAGMKDLLLSKPLTSIKDVLKDQSGFIRFGAKVEPTKPETIDPEKLSYAASNSLLKKPGDAKPNSAEMAIEEAKTGLAKNGKYLTNRIVVSTDDNGNLILEDGRHLLDGYRKSGQQIPLDKVEFTSDKARELFNQTVTPIGKVTQALKEAQPLRTSQEALYTQERGKRIAEARAASEQAGGGYQGYMAKLKALKGDMPKVQYESLKNSLTQEDIDSVFKEVDVSKLNDFDKITAQHALAKLVGAEGAALPTQGELKLLKQVFPEDFINEVQAKRPLTEKLLNGADALLNLPRAMMATADLSAPLRQGVFLVGRPSTWVPAFTNMFKYFASEKAYNGLQESISQRPTYQLMRDNKLALTDMSDELGAREEAFRSNLSERIPVFGTLAKASNRAYTGFLNKLRADTFDNLYSSAKSQGVDSPDVVSNIAKYVNSATGRGDLGPFKQAAGVLNGAFFSPRLMAARVNLINPVTYVKMDPFTRKEALKDLVKFVGTGLTVLGMAKLAGAEVGNDPRSADFGKIKVGDTRYDIWGGFQQYAVLLSRLATQQMVSSTTGKEFNLGEGYKPATSADIIQRFLESKEAPVLSFLTGLAKNQTAVGEKFNIGAEAINRFVPILAQDMYEITKEGGLMGAAKTLPATFGVGVQNYTDQIPFMGKTATGKPNIQWRQAPSFGEDILNKITGTQVSNIPESDQKAMIANREIETAGKVLIDKLEKTRVLPVVDQIYNERYLAIQKDPNFQNLPTEAKMKILGKIQGDIRGKVKPQIIANFVRGELKGKSGTEIATILKRYKDMGVITKDVAEIL
jgi:hypothetical protein